MHRRLNAAWRVCVAAPGESHAASPSANSVKACHVMSAVNGANYARDIQNKLLFLKGIVSINIGLPRPVSERE